MTYFETELLVTKYSIHFILGSGYAFYIRVKGLQSAFVQAAYKDMLVFVIAAEALGQTTERAATTDEKKDTSYMQRRSDTVT